MKTKECSIYRNPTYLALGNNLVVYLRVTSTDNEILLESYALDCTCSLFATTDICPQTRARSVSGTNRLKVGTNGLTFVGNDSVRYDRVYKKTGYPYKE